MTTFPITIEKAGITIEADFDSMPNASQDRVIAYGLKQLLNDATAPVAVSANVEGVRVPLEGKPLADAQAKAAELARGRYDDLLAGILQRARVGSSDPVAAEANRIAIRLIRKSKSFRAFLAEGKLKPADKAATDELAKRVPAIAARPDVQAQARANVEGMAELEVE